MEEDGDYDDDDGDDDGDAVVVDATNAHNVLVIH